MILSLIISFLIAAPFFLYIFNIGNRARSLVLFFGLLIIFIPSFLFLSKYSVIGSSKEIIFVSEVNSKIISGEALKTSDLKKIRNYAPEDELVLWFEEIIRKSIQENNLDISWKKISSGTDKSYEIDSSNVRFYGIDYDKSIIFKHKYNLVLT